MVAAGLVLGACGGGGGGSASDTVPEPARSPNQDLRVAAGLDPFVAGLAATPPNYTIGLATNGPNPDVFETLTNLTGLYGLAPGLATRWESPSPQQWRFTIRPAVKFHNGAPLDAAAVVSTFETIAKRQNRPRGLDPGVARANGDVIEVNLTAPNGRLPEQLAAPSMAIVAPGTQPGNGADPSVTPTGTGPFRFKSYQANTSLVVEANPDYWGPKPQLRSITFRFGPEADAGRLLATRQVDMAGQVPYNLLPKVSGKTDHVIGSTAARAEYLLLNNGGVEDYATLRDASVRQAIGLAIDRRAVKKGGWPDDGEDNDSVIPSAVLADAADRVKPPSQNTTQAGKLLDQAGWSQVGDGIRSKNGKALELTLILARAPEQQAAASVLKGQLAAVGIDVKVVDPTPDSPFTRVNNATFDLFMASQVQDDGNPCALCRFFSIRPGGQLSYAASVGGGAKADDLYDRTYTSPSIDTARRAAADIMNVVVTETFTAVPLASIKTEWLVSPRIRGFDAAALTGDQRWDTVWLTV